LGLDVGTWGIYETSLECVNGRDYHLCVVYAYSSDHRFLASFGSLRRMVGLYITLCLRADTLNSQYSWVHIQLPGNDQFLYFDQKIRLRSRRIRDYRQSNRVADFVRNCLSVIGRLHFQCMGVLQKLETEASDAKLAHKFLNTAHTGLYG
jgi:hypothetical protein